MVATKSNSSVLEKEVLHSQLTSFQKHPREFDFLSVEFFSTYWVQAKTLPRWLDVSYPKTSNMTKFINSILVCIRLYCGKLEWENKMLSLYWCNYSGLVCLQWTVVQGRDYISLSRLLTELTSASPEPELPRSLPVQKRILRRHILCNPLHGHPHSAGRFLSPSSSLSIFSFSFFIFFFPFSSSFFLSLFVTFKLCSCLWLCE